MVTDPPPRAARLRRQFEASDGQPTLRLPPAEPLRAGAAALQAALASGERAPVTRAADRILDTLATFYEVPRPRLTVLGARPHQVYEGRFSWELFGDYTPDTAKIRVWMRTAVLGKVTSFRGLLNTVLHEFCHHLDIAGLGFPDTPHTRGFYGRVDELYHLALDTPPGERKPLAWIKAGGVWRVDWAKVRRGRG